MDTKLLFKMCKAEVHRHLEGSITPAIAIKVAKEFGFPLSWGNEKEVAKFIQITNNNSRSLLDFLKKFSYIEPLFKQGEAISLITEEVLASVKKDNIRYLELRFSPFYMAGAYSNPQKLSPLPQEVVEQVIKGVSKAVEDKKLIVKLLIIIGRELGKPFAWETLKLALAYKKYGVVGVDLAGDEVNYPADTYKELFNKAKEEGLKITIHSGEATTALDILTALSLGADRIGHGVKAIESKEVMRKLVETQTPLELCPTSNFHTGVVSSLKEHPIKTFFKQGLWVTLNTDDPGISNISLSGEYCKLKEELDFSLKELFQINLLTLKASFLSPAEKEKLIVEFTSFGEKHGLI